MPRLRLIRNLFFAGVLLAGLGYPGTSSAQFGGVAPVTATEGVEAVTDAITSAIQEALNARPVIDMKKVSLVNAVAMGKTKGVRYRGIGKTRSVSKGSERMVTGLSDGSVGLWDMSHGRELKRLKGGHKGAVNAITVSEAAGIAVSVGEDGASQVWKLASGKKLARLSGTKKSGAAKAIVVSNNGKLAITTYADGTIRLWTVATGKLIRRMKAFRSSIRATALRSKDTLVVAGSKDGKISVWDVESGEKVLAFKAHKGGVSAIVPLKNEEHFASAGQDGLIRLWDMKSGDEIRKIKGSQDAILALAASSATSQIAAGTQSGEVRIHDANTGKLIKKYTGHKKPINALAFGKNDSVIHTASRDGTSRIFEINKGEELAQIVSSKNGWAAFTKDKGTFTAEGDAADAVSWATDAVSFKMDRFSESHFEPGLLANAAAGKKLSNKTKRPALSVKFAIPPEVKFSTPESDAESDEEEYEISIAANDLGGGITEIRLYQNGKLVKNEVLKDNEDKEITRNFDVKLVNGQNEFRFVALSKDRIESRPAKVKVTYSGAEVKSTMHVVTIGINKYRNPALNLNYGVPDAKGIQKFFKKQPSKIFKQIVYHRLFDKKATKENIEELLKGLETNPEDVVIFYFAGHGQTAADNWYFIPYDVIYPEKDEELRQKGISSKQLDAWVRGVKAQKVVVLMDACKSGAALKAFRGFEERKALRNLSRSSGVHVVAAAAKEQFAVELDSLGHGAFTYSLLQGLQGKAEGRRNDGVITIRELTHFIEQQLPELSEKLGGAAQFPVVNSNGMDFPLAVKM